MISCNCCGTNNAPMAIHRDYWICDDCGKIIGSEFLSNEEFYFRFK